ncbi:MAG: hypothetical protein KKF50_05415 [Nanoarchaeota archaeon]|nr:hypothetical protein [Nanoarchaeota archaeon]
MKKRILIILAFILIIILLILILIYQSNKSPYDEANNINTPKMMVDSIDNSVKEPIDNLIVDELIISEPVIDELIIDELIISEPVIDEPVIAEPVIDEPVIIKSIAGPTIRLSYDEVNIQENILSSFMYFIPLISPTLVDRETSVNNNQKVSIVSYGKKISSDKFYVKCKFKITGSGFHKNVFDSSEIIRRNVGNSNKKPIKNILSYLVFNDGGFGSIEVNGKINPDGGVVNSVDVHFNEEGTSSPVSIGIYSVNPKDGEYNYENRFNETVARVNTLSFKKSEGTPLMSIKIASVYKENKEESWTDKIKGTIANLFIDPLEIDKLGNETMLNFGLAIFKQENEFIFPIAKNLKESIE